VKRYQSVECVRRIQDILRNNAIDLVHLDKTEFYCYSNYLKGIPLAATNHNVESNLMRERSRFETTVSRRLFAFLQYIKTRRYERTALSRVDGYVTCTNADRDFFRHQLGIITPHATIDNGVDCSYYYPLQLEEDHYVLIIGAQNRQSTANYDATMFFIRKIWPYVTQDDPTLKLKIAGRNPDPSVIELSVKYNTVEVLGYVEDEREILARAKALLVPLRIGGGSRLKILTAMGMGKTVISTTKGAKGILCEDGKHILISDRPKQFAAQVLHITRDEEARRSIGKNARDLAVEAYDWEKIGKRLNNFYRSIVNVINLSSSNTT
jgi:glycosyltransferase involved in cell wall biosynthesis